MLEVQFPPRLSYGFRAMPAWDTTINETTAGYETRNANRDAPRRRWEGAKELLPKEDWIALRNFFLCDEVRGAWGSFRFKDYTDFESDGAQVLGTGDGAETEFQLVKTYEVDPPATAHVLTITKPVEGSVTVYLDGVEVDPADYTLDTTTGVITFDVAPGNGVEVTAEFEFDFCARLESDELIAEINVYERFDLRNLVLVEVLGE
jgi:uncharacterized protein (TIGR02217 family)